MSPEFLSALEQAGFNRDKLVNLMNKVDAEKRAVRSALSQLSSEPDEHHARGRERQAKIRRMRDKLGFLTEEREIVRARLGRLKVDTKALNTALHTRDQAFAHAFMAAAGQLLEPETFADIEQRAGEILQNVRQIG